MDKGEKWYENKVQSIVKNKIKKERIKFKGKMITREVVEKQWDIPDVITTDIGFQLMFGFKSPQKTGSKNKVYMNEVNIDQYKKR